MPSTPSPFLMIFHDLSPERYQAMPVEQRQDLMNQWNDWYDRLQAGGKLQDGRPLEPKGRMISGARGERVVDGPYAESKEAIAGYFFLTVSDLEEATAIAKQCPLLPHGMRVEVRPVAAHCHLAGTTARQPAEDMATA